MISNTKILKGSIAASVVALVLVFVCYGVVEAQPQVAPTISITVNKSMVFRLAERAKKVSVAQPQVADVVVVAPTQLLINGKAVGTTSLVVFNEKGDVSNFDLMVTPDVAALRNQLRVVLPEEQIEVSTAGPAIVLKGEVSNEVIYDKVLEITSSYLPPKPPAQVAPSTTQSVNVSTRSQARATLPTSGVGFAGGGQLAFSEEAALTDVDRWADKRKADGIIDLLTIKEVRQIELDVIVAEVATSKLRDIGFDFFQGTRHIQSARLLGDRSGFPGPLLPDGSSISPGTGTIPLGSGLTGALRYVNGSYALTTLYRLIQNKDVTEILAQPRLVMKNGRSGGFLAGGEFPIFTVDDIEFKPFGVRLDFVPTLTWSDRIDLRVFPEVSEIDQTASVNGVPGLKVRRTVNRVEMRDGESLIIAGLLDRRILKDLTKFPLLGDIPILGALFRSTRFRNQESELVIVITPRIVRTMKPGEKPQLPSIEKYDDPDIRQVPLPGSPSRQKPAPRGATIP